MNAAFNTDGNTITHSALFKRPCGMLSGTFKISVIHLPAFSTRSVSLSLSAASSGNVPDNARTAQITKTNTFLMRSSLGLQHQFRLGFSQVTGRDVASGIISQGPSVHTAKKLRYRSFLNQTVSVPFSDEFLIVLVR